jgi:hypothetical protein
MVYEFIDHTLGYSFFSPLAFFRLQTFNLLF